MKSKDVPGLYLAFEGGVGSGKSTQIRLLYQALLNQNSPIPIRITREPGGSKIADEIRSIVQETTFRKEEMTDLCEAFLYAASRAQTLSTVVAPVLNQNGIVLADRSLVSSLAFQGYARGLTTNLVWQINQLAINSLMPHYVMYLNTSVTTALARTSDSDGDKFEQMDTSFHQQVADGYLLVGSMPAFQERWIEIDGEGSVNKVYARIVNTLNPILNKRYKLLLPEIPPNI